MKGIGGNITAVIQTCTITDNSIGEQVKTWTDAKRIKGFLDLSAGDAKYSSYLAKLQESTHVFVADYVPLPGITAENSRLLINGKRYDVLLIDDPMELHEQLEIYLKYTGGQ